MHKSQCLLPAAMLTVVLLLLVPRLLLAETHFLEAESFVPSSTGWKAVTTPEIQRASRVKTMWGADGPADAIATATVAIQTSGRFRVWVRSIQVAAWRGPFRVSVSAAGREIAAKVFDLEALPGVDDWDFAWQSFDADLPTGDVTLTLAKHEQKNCVGYVRHVDCLLLTTDLDLKPDHVPFGPQTFLRVTIGEGNSRSVYLHLFADHYRNPWYSHYAVGRNGLKNDLAVPVDEMLKDGEGTGWCNISHIVYQDSGVALNLSLRHSYQEKAARLRAKLEFGRPREADQNDIEVVKTFDVDAQPNGLVVIVPPDLESPQNVARLRRDRDFAEETGRVADAFPWPTFGKRPTRIPLLVSASIGGYELPVDATVTAREQKTLGYFGFNGDHDRIRNGLWMMQDGSYCRPDVDGMRKRVKQEVEAFRASGRKIEDFACCMLMDEPGGQPASFLAKDEAYRGRFREWLRKLGRSPQDLLEPNWDAVRPIVESERDQHPALHYFTQRFRTVALGDFMATQRAIIEEACGRSFPTVVNFSDGAVYHANFFSLGVDYFDLLDRDDENAIWGEDWANLASTYQCAAFNVDLMRSAARKRGQTIGHYLIAHAARTAWDTKLKATSETARGVRVWMNFAYGPSWGTHEGGPAWKSHVWYGKPELWTANAEITREIGAVEDWLLTAQPTPAEVAILYSSSSDIWTMDNFAFGFDRMHSWLALCHAQTPVDIVSETDVVAGQLDKYRVCYLSGPNLTRAAAAKLKKWVENGGTLWLTAGAASRDEFNRPLDTLTSVLPSVRGELKTHEPFQSAGRFLQNLATRDTVTWSKERLDVLSVQQPQTPRSKASTLATFSNGQPAVVAARAGKGRTISVGFLPALSYIKSALAARDKLEKNASGDATADDRLARSYNPWEFSSAVRERLLTPIRGSHLESPLAYNAPLVDAVYLPCEQGVLIALANQTLRPLPKLALRVRVARRVSRVESVHRGSIPFQPSADHEIRLTLPLDASDWLKITCP